MERTFNKAEDLADHIKEYVNARIDSIKLSVAEKCPPYWPIYWPGWSLLCISVICHFVQYRAGPDHRRMDRTCLGRLSL